MQLHCSGAINLKTRRFFPLIQAAAMDERRHVIRASRLFIILFKGLAVVRRVLA
jgi:hypothetical protein